VVGIGLDGVVPDKLRKQCWMYFPEDDCPFYRVTVFSNYSPYHVPKPGKQWSLMAEVRPPSLSDTPLTHRGQNSDDGASLLRLSDSARV
jgi:hypothetical protein